MRILAIESALAGGSVAVLTGDTTVTTVTLPPGRRTAQTLLPAVHEILHQVGWSPRKVQLVAVTIGPGSFTSLRIGVTAAKAFAYAAGSEIIGVGTLAVMAHQVPSSSSVLWAVLHAERQQLFAARFRTIATGWTADGSTHLVDVASWLGSLRAGDAVTGPPVGDLLHQLPPGVTATPEDTWLPTAASTGQLGWRQYSEGRRADIWSLVPDYVRASAAEEKAQPSC